MPEKSEDIYSTLHDGIGEIVLNRPASHNAVSREMWLAIPDLMKDLQKQSAELIVLKGAGRSFAAGADITELQELDDLDSAQKNWSAIANALDFIYRHELPVVAAIDGACLGGGCLLACACDLRYASDRSSFSVPIAKLGIVLDDANLGRLASLVGVSRAKELIFRARKISASEALNWGLITDLFPVSEFDSAVAKVLAEIKANSPASIKEAKGSFARFLDFMQDPLNQEAVVRSYLLPDSQRRIQRALSKEKE